MQVTPNEFKKRSRRSFLTAGFAALAGMIGWYKILHSPAADGVPAVFRQGFKFNEKIWRKIYSPERNSATPPEPAPGTEPRVNGDVGLDVPVEAADWRLNLERLQRLDFTKVPEASLTLTLEALRKLPQTHQTEVFKCIEGWSREISYAGVRFTDFLSAYSVGTKSGAPFTSATPRSDLYNYVGLETPDGAYYVSIDIESMLHPQVVLASEMNGAPLSSDNGEPLRLIIPHKYGIKNLKRIGRIFFSDLRPPDYWAERGYDWYSGL